MNASPSPGRIVKWVVATLLLFGYVPLVRCADRALPWPPGAVDFAGRVARNHWNLFGQEQRADLEALNRDLREAQQQLE
jgi:hypothetical protein